MEQNKQFNSKYNDNNDVDDEIDAIDRPFSFTAAGNYQSQRKQPYYQKYQSNLLPHQRKSPEKHQSHQHNYCQQSQQQQQKYRHQQPEYMNITDDDDDDNDNDDTTKNTHNDRYMNDNYNNEKLYNQYKSNTPSNETLANLLKSLTTIDITSMQQAIKYTMFTVVILIISIYLFPQQLLIIVLYVIFLILCVMRYMILPKCNTDFINKRKQPINLAKLEELRNKLKKNRTNVTIAPTKLTAATINLNSRPHHQQQHSPQQPLSTTTTTTTDNFLQLPQQQ